MDVWVYDEMNDFISGAPCQVKVLDGDHLNTQVGQNKGGDRKASMEGRIFEKRKK
jgi:hypothetical protein|nr:hypothetical protein Q903MT_gene1244 [Picea sitchensis]